MLNNHKVTLEDLLRFKRAEKPGGAFWQRFDHQLKQAQGRAAITPPSMRFKRFLMRIFGDFWPQASFAGAALIMVALLIGTAQRVRCVAPSLATQVTEWISQGPAEFVSNDLSPQLENTAESLLYAFNQPGILYTHNALDIRSASGTAARSFLF